MEENQEDVVTIKIPKFRGIETSRLRDNPWIMSTFVLIVLAAVLLINGSGTSTITGNVVSGDYAGQKILSLIQMEDPSAKILELNQVDGFYEVIVLFNGEETPIYITLDGENLISGIIPIDTLLGASEAPGSSTGSEGEVIEGSTFLSTEDELCTDGSGKPYALLFSTTWCPHCEWIMDTFDGLKGKYGNKINLQHWEVDIGDNTLTSKVESEVPVDMLDFYEKYNPQGSIPTFVFGCEYYRIGNGYESQNDLVSELGDFEFIIDKLLE